jgi:hypothetical protein
VGLDELIYVGERLPKVKSFGAGQYPILNLVRKHSELELYHQCRSAQNDTHCVIRLQFQSYMYVLIAKG